MKILIVGSEPYGIAGVPNYNRSLALKFVELGHEVFFFFSGAWFKKYNWLMRPYLKINRKDYPFEYAELVNSPSLVFNWGHPLLDISAPQTEKLFIKYLKRIKPDVLHGHSKCGLPASIFELASRQGIKAFYTIHEYGLICQKNVMIDREGKLCSGPSNLEKCVACTEPLNLKKIKFVARMANINKDFLKLLVDIKRKLIREKKGKDLMLSEPSLISDTASKKIKEELKKRLDYMIYLMNHFIDMNICVSNDVKRILMRYGVNEDKLLVQHIGSAIAENQRRDIRQLHSPLVIGNIGGVGYYKGQHILLDAISRMKNKNFVVKIFGKYEQNYVDQMTKEKKKLPVEFLGKYKPEELPDILQQIDVMVLPSICNDTAPQTIFESFSAGIPIIASNIGGFPDFIKDGINGYLFRPGDSHDLANKLEEILSDTAKIRSFAEKIPRLKTITKNALELISLYENSIINHNQSTFSALRKQVNESVKPLEESSKL
jgi:glycosyltransferase involved in cell wall biosynthesis